MHFWSDADVHELMAATHSAPGGHGHDAPDASAVAEAASTVPHADGHVGAAGLGAPHSDAGRCSGTTSASGVRFLAGQDQEAKGTWLGVTTRGRIALLTNFTAVREGYLGGSAREWGGQGRGAAGPVPRHNNLQLVVGVGAIVSVVS